MRQRSFEGSAAKPGTEVPTIRLVANTFHNQVLRSALNASPGKCHLRHNPALSLLGHFRSLVVITFVLAGCGNNGGNGEDMISGQKRVLEVVRAQRGIIEEQIQSSGTVKGIREVWVTAKAQGAIESVSFELGDSVNEGDPLIEIDDATVAYNMAEARERYQSAKMNLNAIENLAEQGAASRVEITNARSQFNSARSALEATREALSNTNVTAPITGHVAQKGPEITRGGYISPGTRIGKIIDLSRVIVEVSVGDREVLNIDTGLAARIIPYAGCPRDSQLAGRVTAIAAGADPATGSFTIIVEADNECGIRLRSGVPVTAVIETARNDSTILIPTSALADSRSIFVFEQGRVYRRRFTMGETIGNRTEALDGIDIGQPVVVTPPPGLTDGEEADTVLVSEKSLWE